MDSMKKCLLLCILIIMVVPAARRFFTSHDSLNGVYKTNGKPSFEWSRFINNDFQEPFSRYINEGMGLRGSFIRINNQIDYSLFSIPHASKIILGKEGYLFGEENIGSYLGVDFAGQHYLDVKSTELKKLQDELWKRKGILLLTIFTPDKAGFFPEMIPARMMKKGKAESNYDYYSRRCVEKGINLIDFSRYFRMMKDTSGYPLYTRTGAHWSSYGALIAADSLIRYLELKLKTRLPEIVIDKIEVTGIPRDEDDDISRTMNLLMNLGQPGLAYPKFHFENRGNRVNLNALFIGDSYYWNWYKPGIIRNLFGNTDFWYYDQDVYPQSFVKTVNTWNINTKESVERQNVIVLMQTNSKDMCDFGYGFVDRVLPDYDTSANNRIREIERYITAHLLFTNSYNERARKMRTSMESVIRADAIFAGNKLLRRSK